MKIKNQKPSDLNSVYKPKIKGDYNPVEYINDTITKTIFTPITPNTTVTITDDSGNNVTEAEVTNKIVNCLGDAVHPDDENFVKELFCKTLIDYQKTNMTVNETFAVQSGIKANLPMPSPTMIYTPAIDIIPVCKNFLAGNAAYDELFATFAFYTRCNASGFYFATESDFNDFKAFVKTSVVPMQSMLSPETIQYLNDFDKLKLDGLTESLKIRVDDNDGNDEYSFPRILTKLLNTYGPTVSPTSFGVLPFSMGEHFSPKNIIFVNIDAHAHATAVQIKKEWELIEKSLKLPIKMIKNGKLTKLTAMARAASKAAGAAATAKSNSIQQVSRAINKRFRKSRPSRKNYAEMLLKVIKKMSFVGQSQNIFKMAKNTFNKPSRRDPDSADLPGKILKIAYKPDIHIYLDTSGSISEPDYQAAIKTCISIARKLNVNLYFNSFSHIMSQTTLIRTQDKSLAQTYAAFQKIPKVQGGTDYAQIWAFINKNPKRCKELSLIITDFGYYAPNQYIKHPKNLYYMPCANISWKTLTKDAEMFCNTAEHNDPFIRKHILM